MKNTLLAILPAILLTMSTGSPLSGQPLTDLDTIIVKTARIPLNSRETGRNISIIQDRDIQKMAFTSLDELLQ